MGGYSASWLLNPAGAGKGFGSLARSNDYKAIGNTLDAPPIPHSLYESSAGDRMPPILSVISASI